MLRRLFLLVLCALLMLTGMSFAQAEEESYGDDFPDTPIIENVPPSEPMITEGDFLRVTSEYLPDEDVTRYTAQLINNPVFPDSTPVSARDLLFSLYVYLDPAYEPDAPMTALPILGAKNYRVQISEERLSAAKEAMQAIHDAGPDHVWIESDSWTQDLQNVYWTLREDYLSACEAEFPACAQAIVDYCYLLLTNDLPGAFGKTTEEILADDGLRVAYAMVQWGYAFADDSMLTFRESGKMWNLEGEKPTVEDFAAELSLAYAGDLRTCWEFESTGTYEPQLPAPEEAFLLHFLGDAKDSISAVSGIRMIDETTLEIDLSGIEMTEAYTLFGDPILSLSAQGDAAQWSPENGLYGHPFGDLSAITAFEGPVLLASSDEIVF